MGQDRPLDACSRALNLQPLGQGPRSGAQFLEGWSVGSRPPLGSLSITVLMASLLNSSPAGAEAPKLLQLEDLYRVDEVSDGITLPDRRSAVYCRRHFDSSTHAVKQSIWRVDDQGPPRPLEAGEPNAFRPQLSPDGRWIVFLSTRPFHGGTRAFDPVPPYSDAAADIWFIPVSGGKAVPLGGVSKPYGRVMPDPFCGRVAFSPDGRRLAFIADEGAVRRTDAEGHCACRSNGAGFRPDVGRIPAATHSRESGAKTTRGFSGVNGHVDQEP
jgi:hypothetical protein